MTTYGKYNATPRGIPADMVVAVKRLKPASLVHANLQGDKSPAWQHDLCWNSRVCRDDREGHDCRVRFKSRTGQLEIGDALSNLNAYRALFAAAIMVCLMCDIRRRENLESKQNGNAHGGKKPSCPLAHTPESAEAKHSY